MKTVDITPTPPWWGTPTSRRDSLDADQRVALHRLRRAQLTEAQRIHQAVADGYLLTPARLTSPCRVAVLAEARQVAMWLMRTRLTWRTPTHNREFPCERIGRLLGGRDHATVLHGVAMIAARLDSQREEDALPVLVGAIGATLDGADENGERAHQRAA